MITIPEGYRRLRTGVMPNGNDLVRTSAGVFERIGKKWAEIAPVITGEVIVRRKKKNSILPPPAILAKKPSKSKRVRRAFWGVA